MISLICRADPGVWTIHGMRSITRASRFRSGGRGSGARERLSPDRSTDTRMPIASSRAANPGTDAEANRDRVMKRPKRPVRNVVPLMQSRSPRHLTAPSGKANSSRPGVGPSRRLSTNRQRPPVAVSTSFRHLWTTCGIPLSRGTCDGLARLATRFRRGDVVRPWRRGSALAVAALPSCGIPCGPSA